MTNDFEETFSITCLLEVGHFWSSSETLKPLISLSMKGFVDAKELSVEQWGEILSYIKNEYPNELPCLFGGYKISSKEWEFHPQCCSTLENLQSWLDILRPDKFEEYQYLEQGHPSPKIQKFKNHIEIHLMDEDLGEPFENCKSVSVNLSRVIFQSKIEKVKEFIDTTITSLQKAGVKGLTLSEIKDSFY